MRPVLCSYQKRGPAMSTTGVEFRTIRESRGLTVDRIASATRIPVRYIEAIDRYEGSLPLTGASWVSTRPMRCHATSPTSVRRLLNP